MHSNRVEDNDGGICESKYAHIKTNSIRGNSASPDQICELACGAVQS